MGRRPGGTGIQGEHGKRTAEPTVCQVDSLNYLGATSAAAGMPGVSPELQSDAMADFVRRLKMITVDNAVVAIVVVAIPLTTTPPVTSDQWPQDLFALGRIGQFADNVLLLYRPNRWDLDRDDPRSGEVDIVVAQGLAWPKKFVVADRAHVNRFVDLPPSRK